MAQFSFKHYLGDIDVNRWNAFLAGMSGAYALFPVAGFDQFIDTNKLMRHAQQSYELTQGLIQSQTQERLDEQEENC